jgi:hypothetical protein
MQPHISFNRSLLTLIAIGVVLMLVIGWLLLTGHPGQSPLLPTATPSSFGSLETAALSLSRSTPPLKDESLLTATATEPDPEAYPGPSSKMLPMSGTPVTETPATPSVTFTPDQIQPLPVGQYDDTDPNIAYDPYWTALKNQSTASSYKGTIHSSSSVGSEASFRFTGKQFRLGYKRGKSFGTVTVIIDDQPSSFNEQALDLVWISPKLSPGDHFVRIIHESGESINLDYIIIVD